MTPSSKLTFAPLYEQVKKAILNRIIAGEWGPGSFLPSEIALAKEYGVSQGTLRKALNALTRENGWSATRAREPLWPYSTKTVPCSPSSFSATGTENASTRFHKSTACGSPRRRTPNGRLSSLPGRQSHPHRPCTYAQRFPVINERVALPTARFPHFNFEFDKVPNTLYEHYQIHFGITVAHATEQIEVTMPDSGDLKRLNIERNHPLLLVTRTSFDLQDRPVEFRISRINTGNHVYRADLR